MVIRRAVILVEVIVGVVILGVALSVLIGVLSRSIAAQDDGERLATAAMLIDEQLNMVLARGPDEYTARYGAEGTCDAPFTAYRWKLDIQSQAAGLPYAVKATILWEAGGRERSASVSTLIAPRLGEDPDPVRQPDQVVERLQ